MFDYDALRRHIGDYTLFMTGIFRDHVARGAVRHVGLSESIHMLADGLGNTKNVADRIDFDPFPYHSMAVWILTQMKRWGQIKGDVDYAGVAKQVYLATDTAKLMKEVGLTPPTTTSKGFKVMGKEFDPGKPDDYVKSFAIKRA